MKNKVLRILICILAIIFIVLLLFAMWPKSTDSNNKTNGNEISQDKLEEICQLATLESHYNNTAKYSQENAQGVLFWKKDREFWMEYTGIVTMGVDIAKVDIKISGNKVAITLPEAEVLSDKLDGNSIKVYQAEDSADLTGDSQMKAISDAQNEMLKNASMDTVLLDHARSITESLLVAYINGVGEQIGKEYEIEITYLEEIEKEE